MVKNIKEAKMAFENEIDDLKLIKDQMHKLNE